MYGAFVNFAAHRFQLGHVHCVGVFSTGGYARDLAGPPRRGIAHRYGGQCGFVRRQQSAFSAFGLSQSVFGVIQRCFMGVALVGIVRLLSRGHSRLRVFDFHLSFRQFVCFAQGGSGRRVVGEFCAGDGVVAQNILVTVSHGGCTQRHTAGYHCLRIISQRQCLFSFSATPGAQSHAA